MSLDQAPDYLEIADFGGRHYVSFPPVPSLVEVPLVLVFGEKTPNALLGIYAFWFLALVAQFTMLRRCHWDERSALLASLAFVFATNLFVTCVRANVWAYGQSLGYCLAIFGLAFVLRRDGDGGSGDGAHGGGGDGAQGGGGGGGVGSGGAGHETRASWPGYLLLALAVGCRPLLALLFPLYLALDARTGEGRPLRRALRALLAGAAPVGLALAAYNLVRFGSPLEFGHNHLDWARKLPDGIWSLSYLPWNAYHAFLRLPEWSGEWPPLRFDTGGTALWLNNAPLVIAAFGLCARRFDPWVRGTCAFALLGIGLGILCYEGRGNTQFGFRYAIDLLPAAFVAFAFAYRRFTAGMAALSALSALVNLYGLAAWKALPRFRG